MGRGIVESGLFRSERYQLERRTSDPTTREGEMWIRTDVAPDTDQLATLRFDAGGSTWDVPIYDVGATTENVEKVWRVPIGGATGFIPITDDSPTHSALKYQHNGASFGVHDALKASAVPDSVVDNFEDADADPAGVYETGDTLTDYYGGDTGDWERQTSTVQSGGHALGSIGTTNVSVISSTTGLNEYPSQGDSFACYTQATGNNNQESNGIFYGTPQEAGSGSISGYFAQVRYGSDSFHLFLASSGSFTELDASTATLSVDTWYDIQVSWGTDGSHAVDIVDSGSVVASLSTTDSTYTSGGIGFRQDFNTSNSVSYFDEYRPL